MTTVKAAAHLPISLPTHLKRAVPATEITQPAGGWRPSGRGHVLDAQSHRGVAEYQEVSRVVARNPEIAELAERNVGPLRKIGLHLAELGCDRRPTQVEHIGGLADPLAVQQPADHVPKTLNLRTATLALE